jgi:hypothetical protein
MDDIKKPVSGYLSAQHVFGRSIMTRAAKGFYYLKWQLRFQEDLDQIISLTKKQYQDIKAMLMPDPEIIEHEISDRSKTVVYYHKTSPKHYARIKKYLIKNNLLKEHHTYAYRLTARS